MNLSERTNTVILHYGCADFNKPVHTIFWRRLSLKRKVIYFERGLRFIKLLG